MPIIKPTNLNKRKILEMQIALCWEKIRLTWEKYNKAQLEEEAFKKQVQKSINNSIAELKKKKNE